MQSAPFKFKLQVDLAGAERLLVLDVSHWAEVGSERRVVWALAAIRGSKDRSSNHKLCLTQTKRLRGMQSMIV